MLDLRLPGTDFLRERQWHGIHQVRAAGLDRVLEFLPARTEATAEVCERGQQSLLDQQSGRDVNGRWHDIVAALAEVDMIIRMDRPSEASARQRRDDLVRIHVRAGPGTGLEQVNRKLRIMLAIRHRARGAADRLSHVGRQVAKLGVNGGRAELDQPERAQDRARHGESARRKILYRALRLGAP